MSKKMYVSYNRFLICGDHSPWSTGVKDPSYDHPIVGIDMWFQYHQPFTFAADADPLKDSPLEGKIAVPQNPPAMSFDPVSGFTFEADVVEIDNHWSFQDCYFGVIEDLNNPIFMTAASATLEQVHDFLGTHRAAIHADRSLQSTSWRWAEEPATTRLQLVMESAARK